MNRREKVLLLVTALVVIPLLAYHFLLADWIEGLAGQTGGSLSRERRQFEQYREMLEERPTIEQEYSRIDFSQSQPQPGQDATDHFSNELYNLLTGTFGIQSPQIEPARPQPIKDVPDYYFVELTATVDGSPQEILRLLTNMETRGVLIKSFTIGRTSGFGQMEDQLRLTVDVARLVKHTDESRSRIRPWTR